MLATLGLSALALLGAGMVGTLIRGEEPGEPTLVLPTEAPDASEAVPGVEPPGTTGVEPTEDAGTPNGARQFPDGFVLAIQPCASEPTGPDCDSSGAVNDGTVWILLSFEEGSEDDVLGVTVVAAAGDDPVGGGEVALADLGCAGSCDGWTFFMLENLPPGAHRVNVNRNGEPGGSVPFVVEPAD